MRLFIAINLNEEMKDALIDIRDTMRTYGIRGKDTPPENMHLTLAFIGEYDDPERVKEVVESIEIRPFEMKLKGIGAFRDLWWVGTENSAPLMAISRRLRRALAEADIPFDKKKFSPITENGGVSMTVDHISLMRSDRGKCGMIYTEL